jgi:hypothetical protein
MKNKKLISAVVTIFLLTAIVSCKKENSLAATKRNMQKVDFISSAPKGQDNGNQWSDTFRLVSFSGTKLRGDGTYSAYLRLDWSVVGEKDIAYYVIEGSTNGNDNWVVTPAYSKITISSPNDSLTTYSIKSGFGNTGSGKKINKDDYFRLKVVYLDNRILYSTVVKVNYSFVWNPW